MKVLIISHNCFSTTQNMGKTMVSLFSKFKKEELMQLYLYPSIPNIDVCGDYYRITDKDVIRAIIKRNHCGRKIFSEEIIESNKLFESQYEAEKYSDINRKNFIMRRLRDIIWHLGKWKSKELKRWLKEGKPDVVFYALGDATFSQNIAMWVSKYFDIPLVTYVCDEYYFYYKKNNLIKRFIGYSLLKNIKKTIKKSKRLITICDDLGIEYKKQFDIPFTTIMTGSSLKPDSIPTCNNSNKISYIGNLSLNRWKSIRDIAEAVEEINNDFDTEYEFLYYGSECQELANQLGINYGGWLTPELVKAIMRKSLLLIHTETFDIEYRDRLRYSISTKIADCLASGVSLFAYGPDDIASMQHLITNKCAFITTDLSSLKNNLQTALIDSQLRKTIAQKAIIVAKNYHDANSISRNLYNVLESVL